MQLDNDSVSKHLLYHFKVRKKVTQTKNLYHLIFLYYFDVFKGD